MPTVARHLEAEASDRGALWPMDLAVEYLTRRLWHILPVYTVAMAPFSLAILLLLDVVDTQHRAALGDACALLTAATVWRWGGLAVVQRRVQSDYRGLPPQRLRRRMLPILMVRLLANFAICWGGILVLPAFYGLFVSGFATPMLLEGEAAPGVQVRAALSWVATSFKRLSRVLWALMVLTVLVGLGMAAVIGFAVQFLLPGLLGIDAADLRLTLTSPAGLFCAAYGLFVIMDVLWAVLAVFLFYDLQSRRLGTDLAQRLKQLQETAA